MSLGFSKQSPSHKVATVPAPVGGINAYDSLAAMPATDAINMVNWYPQPYGCVTRKGSIRWTSGINFNVETLLTWHANTGADKLFAIANGAVYDITTQGAVGAALLSGLSNSEWWYTHFGNVAGSYILAVNGLDDIVAYKAAGIFRIVLGDGIVVNTWKNLDPKNASHITVHQGRVWAAQKNSTLGWYLPTDQYYGVLASYDFGPLFPNGGFLDVLTTWTIDSGDGAADCLVAISSKGDVVVYEGSDVAVAASWRLKGVYYIGAPISGRRYVTKVAGDLFILTITGIVSLSTVFLSSQVSVSSDTVYSKKIQNLLSDATSESRDLDGWQILYTPGINQLYINVPTVSSLGSSQIVANTLTTAWTIFTGWAASCWEQFDDAPYFGTANGTVYKAWTGFKDAVGIDGSGGSDIRTIVQQAYSYLDAPAVQKQVGMYRPNFLVAAPIAYSSAILYDFAVTTVTDPSGVPVTGVSLWGSALWGISYWAGGLNLQNPWVQAQGIGVAAALALKTSAAAEVTWVSTDYAYKIGGIL